MKVKNVMGISKEDKMKYMKMMLLMIVMALFSVACGSSGGGGDDGAADTTAPTVPGNVLATPTSSTEIGITWDQSTDLSGVTGYKVYKAEGSGASDADYAFLIDVTNPSASDTGLSIYTEYCYKVTSYDAAGNTSARSAEACTTIDDNYDNNAPTIPLNVIASAASSTQIDLSWDASTDDFIVKGYNIYRDSVFLKAVTAGTSTSDTGLSTSTQYCYTVSAYDGGTNESGQSSPDACATTTANNAPIPIITSPVDGSSFTVGDSINFSGTADDVEDGTLSDSSFVWTSNVYGQIGTGNNFNRSDLCAGSYTINLTVQDSEGLPGSALSNINIASPSGGKWTNTFGDTNDDEGYEVQQTSDCGYIIAGYTTSLVTGNKEIYLAKTDSSGNSMWTKTFNNGSSFQRGYSVQQTTDGGYIIVGYTGDFSAGGREVYLIKTDSNGDTSPGNGWTKTFDGSSNNDEGYSVKQTSDGGYIIAGYTMSGGRRDIYVIKTDSNGSADEADGGWERSFSSGGTDDREGYSVQQTSDGGYIIAGYTVQPAGTKDVYLLKIDISGNKEWSKAFGGSGDEEGLSVQQTSDNGYVIAGYTDSEGAGNKDVYLIKTDSNGNTDPGNGWTKTFGTSDFERGLSVSQTSDGGYIITGYKGLEASNTKDVYLIKTDSNGDTDPGKGWTRTFGGSSNDEGSSVKQTSDGGYIITGHTESEGAGGKDVYLVKTDSSGNIN